MDLAAKVIISVPVHDTLFLPLSCLDKGPREVFNKVTLSLYGLHFFLYSLYYVDRSFEEWGCWNMWLLGIR